ncbi:hypothetical protein ABIB40_001696 [Pedobacter sp. UYP30]
MITALYSILGLIALILLAAIFTKKDYTIISEITINQPDTVVYDHFRFFK